MASARATVARVAGPRGRAAWRRLRHEPEPGPPPGGVAYARFAAPDEHPRVLWPLYPPLRYEGQLADWFQAGMAKEREYLTEADCDFYHSVDLPDGRLLHGVWDLRGHEAEYFGGVEFGGRRVLELGPASGGLTAWLDRSGAEVVGLDAGFDLTVDLMPWHTADVRGMRLDIMRVAGACQNAWWYTHRELGLGAKMVYAPIYELPGDLGRFDVSVFGAVLLHLRRPFDALAEAARLTDRMIVVTDMVDPELRDETRAVVCFNPARHSHPTTLWWGFSPAAIVEYLRVLGFPNARTTWHEQLHHFDHDRSAPARPAEMFTVVAERD
jgi:O-methyltransferase